MHRIAGIIGLALLLVGASSPIDKPPLLSFMEMDGYCYRYLTIETVSTLCSPQIRIDYCPQMGWLVTTHSFEWMGFSCSSVEEFHLADEAAYL